MCDNLDNAMLELDNAEMFNDVWKNPVVQWVLGALKIIPGVDESITGCLESYQKKKQEKVCDIIFSDGSITLEMVKNVTFLMEFAKMLDIINHLTSNTKVEYIGNLFKNSFKNEWSDTNEFEEYLAKINDLSERELYLLYLLQKTKNDLSIDTMEADGSDGKGIDPDEVWRRFISNANEDEEMITSIIAGTMRSGFCNYIPINFAIGIKGVFMTTPYFDRFLDLINKK